MLATTHEQRLSSQHKLSRTRTYYAHARKHVKVYVYIICVSVCQAVVCAERA